MDSSQFSSRHDLKKLNPGSLEPESIEPASALYDELDSVELPGHRRKQALAAADQLSEQSAGL